MTYFTNKLANGTLSDSDRKTIEWQRERMDAIDENGNIVDREPTMEEAAAVLDEDLGDDPLGNWHGRND